jgi:uncharacterized protein (DUF1684 family)
MMSLVPVLVALASSGAAAADSRGSYGNEVAEWRAHREAALRSDDGWLTVTGLFWLHPGASRIGTDPSNDLLLPEGSAPGYIGTLTVTGSKVTFDAEKSSGVQLNGRPAGFSALKPDAEGAPDTLAVARLKLLLLKRGDRYALRLKDNDSVIRKDFGGLRWYPVEEKWRIKARLIPPNEPRKLVFDTIIGEQDALESAGYVVFEFEGKQYRLEAAGRGPDLFLVFRDGTSGKTTYGSSRFLNAKVEADGTVILDFNKAYNPPCSFTPYATCPLPPPQNRLSLAITAGELKYQSKQSLADLHD